MVPFPHLLPQGCWDPAPLPHTLRESSVSHTCVWLQPREAVQGVGRLASWVARAHQLLAGPSSGVACLAAGGLRHPHRQSSLASVLDYGASDPLAQGAYALKRRSCSRLLPISSGFLLSPWTPRCHAVCLQTPGHCWGLTGRCVQTGPNESLACPSLPASGCSLCTRRLRILGSDFHPEPSSSLLPAPSEAFLLLLPSLQPSCGVLTPRETG